MFLSKVHQCKLVYFIFTTRELYSEQLVAAIVFIIYHNQHHRNAMRSGILL